MKVKLLRKIRKRFSIYYNPDGILYSNSRFITKYLVRDTKSCIDDIFDSEQECKNWILGKVRKEYLTSSKNYKPNVKVWYNK